MWKFMLMTLLVALVCLFPAAAPARAADEVATLKKENELLMKEIELVKKENDLLKKEIELMKRELAGQPTAKTAVKSAKVTLDDMEYEFVSLKRNGYDGVLTIAVTSKKGQKQLAGVGLRLMTPDGKEVRAGSTNLRRRGQNFEEGVRSLVELKINQLPLDVEEVSTIFLPGLANTSDIGGGNNPPILKGPFKVEK